jgi:FKBP12-rapamycin complex-associated protein
LIDIEYDENTKTTRLANYLRLGLQSNDATVMTSAAVALGIPSLIVQGKKSIQCPLHIGRLAQSSSSLTNTAVFVEFEVKRAFEWLQDEKHDSRRHAAVLGTLTQKSSYGSRIVPFVSFPLIE